MLILSGCYYPEQTDSPDMMKEIREDFAKRAEEFNNEALAWQSRVDMLYHRADINLQDGVWFADSLIQNDPSLDKWKLSELQSIVGQLYYDHDSTLLALERFQLHEQLTIDSPGNKANKAGCYTRLGDTALAM